MGFLPLKAEGCRILLLKLETQERAKDSLASTSLGARIINMLYDAPLSYAVLGIKL